MNIVLWVLQILLAVVFFAHGWFLLFPPPNMVELMNSTMAPAFRIFLGLAEVLAAVGLIVPAVTRMQPWLVPAAAAGLVIVMVAATGLHLVRGEIGSALITAMLLGAAVFVTYMRWKVYPIRPRVTA